MNSKTNVQKFFDRKTIFITGATGLLGSMLVEKLLRSCPDVKAIYILIRHKWGSSHEKRFQELLNMTLFDDIRNKNPRQLHKIVPLGGDLEKPELGLSSDDLEIIVKRVNCVFHLGASVKLMDPLSRLMRTNVLGTEEIIRLCKRLADLQSFVYVSTGYSQALRPTIDEIFYKSDIGSEAMLLMAKSLDNQAMDKLTPIIVDKRHYIYSFTKSVAEDLLQKTAGDLPLASIRPTIVCSSWREPLPGYTDNMHSFSLFMTGFGLGLIHVLPSKPHYAIDIIPADYVVNNIIAAAWEVGTSWNTTEKSVRIYNCSSSHQNPLTFGKYEELLAKHDKAMPSTKKVWHRFVFISPNRFVISLLYFLQLPYMHFLNFLNKISGNWSTNKFSFRSVKFYRNANTLVVFGWKVMAKPFLLKSDNTKRLFDKLEEEDKKLFDFDVSAINWDSVIYNCVKGIRLYILKEDPGNIPKAQQKQFVLKIVHYVSLCFWLILIYYIL